VDTLLTQIIFFNGGVFMKKMVKYDMAFRQEALRLSQEEGSTQASVERDLGLWPGAISVWKKEFSSEGLVGSSLKRPLKPQDAAMRQLQRENERLKRERDILKKAVAIFSVDPNRYSRS
jgi:transposase